MGALMPTLQVPYLRIPLVVSFFASDDRIHALQSPTLQALLDAALFEPGNHLPLDCAGREPVDVPSSEPELLGTPHHLLLNELSRSPNTVLSGVLTLLRQARTPHPHSNPHPHPHPHPRPRPHTLTLTPPLSHPHARRRWASTRTRGAARGRSALASPARACALTVRVRVGVWG